MKINVGSTDKVLRIIIGLAIVGIGAYLNSWWGAIGLIPILTALINWCPMYAIFGVKTCAKE